MLERIQARADGTVNAGASALRFFFKVTPKRPDLAEEVGLACLAKAACLSQPVTVIFDNWRKGGGPYWFMPEALMHTWAYLTLSIRCFQVTSPGKQLSGT
jgi:hypothetical protein